MPNTRVRDAAARATNLIPFDAGSIRGDYAAVCSPVSTLPAELQDAQRARTAAYMAGEGRMSPASAPRYFVTSRGRLIAWVNLDGSVHYLQDPALPRLARLHRDMIRAAWPTRFTLTSDTYSYAARRDAL
jgi:hypothetical protein